MTDYKHKPKHTLISVARLVAVERAERERDYARRRMNVEAAVREIVDFTINFGTTNEKDLWQAMHDLASERLQGMKND